MNPEGLFVILQCLVLLLVLIMPQHLHYFPHALQNRTPGSHGDISCPPQALQSRTLDGAFALITGIQLFAYILVFQRNVFDVMALSELLPAFVYLALCTAPAWAGFRAKEGEHSVQRSRALILSNIVLALLMVLWGSDVIAFPTSFMRVSELEVGAALSIAFCALLIWVVPLPQRNYEASTSCSVLCRPNRALQL